MAVRLVKEHGSDALDWTVAHGLPDIDPILDASDTTAPDQPWHHVKASVRMWSIVDGVAMIAECGTELATPDVEEHDESAHAACAQCVAARAARAARRSA